MNDVYKEEHNNLITNNINNNLTFNESNNDSNIIQQQSSVFVYPPPPPPLQYFTKQTTLPPEITNYNQNIDDQQEPNINIIKTEPIDETVIPDNPPPLKAYIKSEPEFIIDDDLISPASPSLTTTNNNVQIEPIINQEEQNHQQQNNIKQNGLDELVVSLLQYKQPSKINVKNLQKLSNKINNDDDYIKNENNDDNISDLSKITLPIEYKPIDEQITIKLPTILKETTPSTKFTESRKFNYNRKQEKKNNNAYSQQLFQQDEILIIESKSNDNNKIENNINDNDDLIKSIPTQIPYKNDSILRRHILKTYPPASVKKKDESLTIDQEPGKFETIVRNIRPSVIPKKSTTRKLAKKSTTTTTVKSKTRTNGTNNSNSTNTCSTSKNSCSTSTSTLATDNKSKTQLTNSNDINTMSTSTTKVQKNNLKEPKQFWDGIVLLNQMNYYPRRSLLYKYGDYIVSILRQIIYKFYKNNLRAPHVAELLEEYNNSINNNDNNNDDNNIDKIYLNNIDLYDILWQCGNFYLKKMYTNKKHYVLFERLSIINWRNTYLNEIQKIRSDPIKPTIIYIWFKITYSKTILWKDILSSLLVRKSQKLLKLLNQYLIPSSNNNYTTAICYVANENLGIINNLTQTFDLQENRLVEMKEFKKWFHKLINYVNKPNNTKNLKSLNNNKCYFIIGDYTPISSKFQFKPNRNWSIDDLSIWLKEKCCCPKRKDMLNLTETYSYINIIYDQFNGEIEKICNQYNMNIIYLPPQHHELNPIEHFWHDLNKYIINKYINNNINNIYDIVMDTSVYIININNNNEWYKYIEKIKDIELKYIEIQNIQLNGILEKNSIKHDINKFDNNNTNQNFNSNITNIINCPIETDNGDNNDILKYINNCDEEETIDLIEIKEEDEESNDDEIVINYNEQDEEQQEDENQLFVTGNISMTSPAISNTEFAEEPLDIKQEIIDDFFGDDNYILPDNEIPNKKIKIELSDNENN